MLKQWHSQNYTFGMAPLTALIGYLNVLLEYFYFLKFSLAGPYMPGPPSATPHYQSLSAINLPIL